MTPVDYDVYLCSRDAGDRSLASEVAAGLARRGFRVFVPQREPGAATEAARLKAIEDAPDFILLSAPAVDGGAAGPADPRAADLAHAFKTKRNIVVLADPADADPLTSPDPPGLRRFAPWQRVIRDRGRPRESIALVAYRLESAPEVDDRRLMKTTKRAFIAAGALLAIAIALRAVPAAVNWWNRPKAPPPLPRFTLYWTADAQRLVNGRWTRFSVSDGATFAGGDQLTLHFSTGSDGYAYVLVRDSQGGVSVLFPGSTVRGASRVRAGTMYDAPASGRGFTIEPQAGAAALYLFAGHEPLENLEELTEEPESGVTQAARLELLTSTLQGLLDGKHAAAVRPVRTRAGHEIVDYLQPAPPPSAWPGTAGSLAAHRPATQLGLLSAVVEIRVALPKVP